MDMPMRSFGKPAADHLGLVRAGIVHNDVGIEIIRHRSLDLVEEPAELNGAVPGEAAADDGAELHIQRGEEGCGAAAGVVMGVSLDLSGAHRQQRLGAVERLHLRLLINAQDDGTIRRRKIQADDIANLFHKQWIGGQLEGLGPMRLQTKGAPDAMDRRRRLAAHRRHRAQAPVGRPFGSRFQRAPDGLCNRLVADLTWRSQARFIE